MEPLSIIRYSNTNSPECFTQYVILSSGFRHFKVTLSRRSYQSCSIRALHLISNVLCNPTLPSPDHSGFQIVQKWKKKLQLDLNFGTKQALFSSVQELICDSIALRHGRSFEIYVLIIYDNMWWILKDGAVIDRWPPQGCSGLIFWWKAWNTYVSIFIEIIRAGESCIKSIYWKKEKRLEL